MLIFFSEAELVGGGLVRSVGDWKELKELRDSGERVRADERILPNLEGYIRREYCLSRSVPTAIAVGF